jgi:glycosyltransferase involved in cell wall biosynthesis
MAVVSVLVAAYNAEKYLRPCLRSLMAQTMGDFEALCVDDGSTDSTLSILQSYANEDKRFKVLHLENNSGAAYARNIALKNIQGQFVCFLDSDDYLSADALEKAVATFKRYEETGCVLFRCINVFTNGRKKEYAMQPFEKMSGAEAFEASLTWKIHGIYMVRADIHCKYPYDESCHDYSDDNTTRLHYLASHEVRMCGGKYYYRQHTTSTTHKIDVSHFEYLEANASMKRQLEEMGTDSRILRKYENIRWLNIIDEYMFFFINRNMFSNDERRKALSMMRSAWQSIHTSSIEKHLRRKFGYMPLRISWRLFRAQEETYFELRKIKDKMMGNK